LGYMDNERVDHIFPRADGVLIGGVKLDGDWRRELDPAISADIIRRTSTIESGIAEAKVRGEFPGLRPGRAQVRLELEQRPSPSGPAVIHNYGHGSVGYTLSWGCAEEVAALAREFV
ncbi:MAG: FAD-binding oxidoreductase, partial [Anaerolineae bacterium]|nr:FAD-binding oxidoreductase [Anaerolineae bacterium]